METGYEVGPDVDAEFPPGYTSVDILEDGGDYDAGISADVPFECGYEGSHDWALLGPDHPVEGLFDHKSDRNACDEDDHLAYVHPDGLLWTEQLQMPDEPLTVAFPLPMSAMPYRRRLHIFNVTFPCHRKFSELDQSNFEDIVVSTSSERMFADVLRCGARGDEHEHHPFITHIEIRAASAQPMPSGCNLAVSFEAAGHTWCTHPSWLVTDKGPVRTTTLLAHARAFPIDVFHVAPVVGIRHFERVAALRNRLRGMVFPSEDGREFRVYAPIMKRDELTKMTTNVAQDPFSHYVCTHFRRFIRDGVGMDKTEVRKLIHHVPGEGAFVRLNADEYQNMYESFRDECLKEMSSIDVGEDMHLRVSFPDPTPWRQALHDAPGLSNGTLHVTVSFAVYVIVV